MATPQRVRLTRRDMLKLSAGGAGMFALTASGFAVPRGFAGGGSGSGSLYVEAFPTSPLILTPFTDQLPIPQALRPADPANPTNPQNITDPKTGKRINCLDRNLQDSHGTDPSGPYFRRYGKVLGAHSVWHSDLKLPEPIVYKI